MLTTEQIRSMTPEQVQAEILRLQTQNAVLSKPRKLTLRVSAKGALSLYGMGKFPVTLYQEQWEKVLDEGDAIRAFMAENRDLLKRKGEVTDTAE